MKTTVQAGEYDPYISPAIELVQLSERQATWQGYRPWNEQVPELYQVSGLSLAPWSDATDWLLWQEDGEWRAERGTTAAYGAQPGYVPGDIELFGPRHWIIRCVAPQIADMMRQTRSLFSPVDLA